MALDEPRDTDKKFEQDGYTIVVDPRVAELAGELTVEISPWGGLQVVSEHSGGW